MENRQSYYGGRIEEFLVELKETLYNGEIFQYIKKRVVEATSKVFFDKKGLLESYCIFPQEIHLIISESHSLHVQIVRPLNQTLKIIFREINGQNIETIEIEETGRRTLLTQYKKYGLTSFSNWSLCERNMHFVFDKKRDKFIYFDREYQKQSYFFRNSSNQFYEAITEKSKDIFVLHSAKEYLTEHEPSHTDEGDEHHFGRCGYYNPLEINENGLDIKTTLLSRWLPYSSEEGSTKMNKEKQKLLIPSDKILK